MTTNPDLDIMRIRQNEAAKARLFHETLQNNDRVLLSGNNLAILERFTRQPLVVADSEVPGLFAVALRLPEDVPQPLRRPLVRVGGGSPGRGRNAPYWGPAP